jgi:hypothetical protein
MVVAASSQTPCPTICHSIIKCISKTYEASFHTNTSGMMLAMYSAYFHPFVFKIAVYNTPNIDTGDA